MQTVYTISHRQILNNNLIIICITVNHLIFAASTFDDLKKMPYWRSLIWQFLNLRSFKVIVYSHRDYLKGKNTEHSISFNNRPLRCNILCFSKVDF